MKKIKFCAGLWVLSLGVFLGGCSATEVPFADYTNVKDPGAPNFYYQIACFPTDDPQKTELRIYFAVPYDNLVFTWQDSGFSAQYELAVYLLTDKENLLKERRWTRSIFTKSYKKTNSPSDFDQFHWTYVTSPQPLRILLELTDHYSKRTVFQKKPIKIKDFSRKKVGVSDLLFFSKEALDDSTGTIQGEPNLTGEFSDDFYVYVEIRRASDISATEIIYSVLHEDQVIWADTLSEYYAKSHWTLVDIGDLSQGDYLCRVRVSSGKHGDQVTQPFRVKKTWEFKDKKALDEAIAQLEFVAPSEVIDSLRMAETFEERKELFEKFWKRVDPTPDTEYNELREEYYRRVRYANKHFGNGQPGWSSDRGRIYIIYGPPDVIRRGMDSEFRAYEIWYYERINRQFYFVDERGTGDFRLVQVL